jgi:hypothetical protein
MNDLHPSGEWVGYYTYTGKLPKCPMHLTLNFVDGLIRGAGIDKPGQFVIDGVYTSKDARWSKHYVGKHSVSYEGQFKNEEIFGSWSLTQMHEGRVVSLQGEFRIWPLPEGIYGDDEPLQSILDKEIRRKT